MVIVGWGWVCVLGGVQFENECKKVGSFFLISDL